MVDSADILAKLRSTTEQNDGVPLPSRRFSEETGIRKKDLQRAGWTNHGALLKSQGFTPQFMKPAYSDDRLLEPLAQLTLSLGHFPNHSERAVERHRNPGFPSNEAYLRRARRETLEHALLNWLRARGVYPQVVAIIERLPGVTNEDVPNADALGFYAALGYVRDEVVSLGKRPESD